MSDKQVLRIGKISSVNYEKGTARVTYEDRDGATTVELPFIAWEYWMPEIEDMVVTGHLSNSSTSAVILGRLWHDEHRPIEGKEGIYRKEYEPTQGAAYERYDSEAKSLKVVAGGVTLTLQGGTLAVSGNLTVSGDLSVTGKLNVTGAIEAGGTVKAGGDISGPNLALTGSASVAGSVTATGDVTAAGISGKSHTHTAPYGETSGPH